MRLLKLSCVAFALAAAACRKAAPPAASTEVVVVARTSLPKDPADLAWNGVPKFVAPLILQDMVEPRQLELSTREVVVQALSDGRRMAVRLEWADASDDAELRPGRFSDACALQLPARVAADVPAPQMGEEGKPVEITLWRAAWQAVADGKVLTIEALYPNAKIDHYPFEAAAATREMAELYSPARSLGNDMASPGKAVQDLLASGPGTLAPRAGGDSDGRGQRTSSGWSVVLTRSLPAGLVPGARTQMAFAVWQGSGGEVGARKMRTGWVPLLLEAKP